MFLRRLWDPEFLLSFALATKRAVFLYHILLPSASSPKAKCPTHCGKNCESKQICSLYKLVMPGIYCRDDNTVTQIPTLLLGRQAQGSTATVHHVQSLQAYTGFSEVHREGHTFSYTLVLMYACYINLVLSSSQFWKITGRSRKLRHCIKLIILYCSACNNEWGSDILTHTPYPLLMHILLCNLPFALLLPSVRSSQSPQGPSVMNSRRYFSRLCCRYFI
jgi:hypothetical protein